MGIGGNMKKTFAITGMTCSACSNHIEKAVNALPGINNAQVNLLQNMMQVDFDESQTSVQKIVEAVEKSGYGVADEESSSEDKQVDEVKTRLYLSIAFLIPLLYIAMGEMVGLPLPAFLSGHYNGITFGMIQFLLSLVIVYLNRSYFINGFKSLFHKAPTMDTLIAIGSSAAILYGIYAIIMIGQGLAHQDFDLVMQYQMDLYFESAGAILTFITVGKFLETRSKAKTSDAIKKLMDLSPQFATVLRNDTWEKVAIEDVVVNDYIIVKSGETIPVDGMIEEGEATINESAISGESLPIEKTVENKVTGGTIVVNGYVKMRATRVGENTTLSQIIRLVQDANATKAPIAKLADQVSSVFVPIVIGIAIISIFVWLLVGEPIGFALTMGIAVLIISCPCSLGLATPTAIMVGSGKGAEHGILFKSAESLEMVGKVSTIVFDKTGTVTLGRPTITGIVTHDGISEETLLQIALDIEHTSEHPLAKAIVEHAEKLKLNANTMDSFEQHFGFGIETKRGSSRYLAGNEKMMQHYNIDYSAIREAAQQAAGNGEIPLFFCEDDTLIGMITLADEIKESSAQAIDQLQKMGIEVILLTGDNKKTAAAIAKRVHINHVISDVLPQDKEKYIRTLHEQGKLVAMVGDGINDAPALAKADVGIAIGAGSDIAIDSADIVLMKSDILDVVKTIQLSKATMRNIKQNLFWAFIYNIIGIPIAAGLFFPVFGIKLNPMFASLAMSLSSLFVVSNALRLRFFKLNINQGGKIEMKTKLIQIEGMSCGHCSKRVEDALKALNIEASVDLENAVATVVVSEHVSDEMLTKAVVDAGYQVVSISER